LSSRPLRDKISPQSLIFWANSQIIAIQKFLRSLYKTIEQNDSAPSYKEEKKVSSEPLVAGEKKGEVMRLDCFSLLPV
jgi:hypothetical protein